MVYIAFLVTSTRFAEVAVINSMKGLSQEMASTLYIDAQGQFQMDSSEIKLKWGFDHLYSNLAFRLVDKKQQKAVFFSVPLGTEGYLFNEIDINLAEQNTHLKAQKIQVYRLSTTLDGKDYFFDVARSDLLMELANEAVEPAIADVTNASILVSFLLFLLLNFIAIKLIIKPAESLTAQIKKIKPDDLTQRLDVSKVPKELLPIALALNEALEKVQHSFSEQKRFIADAAHELRTPLTIFLNRLELKIPPSEAKNELLNDARFISRIVEQLLDLSRAQNLHGQEIKPISLPDVVKNVCSHLAPMAVDKAQTLELEDNSDGPNTIIFDEGELTVVIKNLLENAIKHTPTQSTIQVTINNKRLDIADSGDGISSEEQTRIFERFWRKNQSDRSGSGLGLAIIKALLDRYQASIDISKDETLGGARFTVRFR